MDHLTAAVRRAVAEENWYAALALALTLPDICGRLETPDAGSKTRYVAWCQTYLEPTYTGPVGPDRTPHVFLHAEDCYALRCAVLHEGREDISAQTAAKALDSFRWVAPKPGSQVHLNQVNGRLQLQVDIFSEDVSRGVDAWLRAVPATDVDVRSRMEDLMTIETLGNSISF